VAAAMAIAISIKLCLSELARHSPHPNLFTDLAYEPFQHD
jgi:hypothetical protein